MISGGAGGIRTLDRALQPYNGLANRRLQPLGHSSVRADMPEAGASRKRQIQVTPGPFGGAAALKRSSRARQRAAELAFESSFPGLLTGLPRRISRSPLKVAAIVRRDGDSTGPRSRHFQRARYEIEMQQRVRWRTFDSVLPVRADFDQSERRSSTSRRNASVALRHAKRISIPKNNGFLQFF